MNRFPFSQKMGTNKLWAYVKLRQAIAFHPYILYMLLNSFFSNMEGVRDTQIIFPFIEQAYDLLLTRGQRSIADREGAPTQNVVHQPCSNGRVKQKGLRLGREQRVQELSRGITGKVSTGSIFVGGLQERNLWFIRFSHHNRKFRALQQSKIS